MENFQQENLQNVWKVNMIQAAQPKDRTVEKRPTLCIKGPAGSSQNHGMVWVGGTQKDHWVQLLSEWPIWGPNSQPSFPLSKTLVWKDTELPAEPTPHSTRQSTGLCSISNPSDPLLNLLLCLNILTLGICTSVPMLSCRHCSQEIRCIFWIILQEGLRGRAEWPGQPGWGLLSPTVLWFQT